MSARIVIRPWTDRDTLALADTIERCGGNAAAVAALRASVPQEAEEA